METDELKKLQYPIGTYKAPLVFKDEIVKQYLQEIEDTPAMLRKAAEGLSDEQLDTPYRPGGWTVRQVIHHLPDSHINSYVRFKLALTEDIPAVKTYEEALWADLKDSILTPVEDSLVLFELLHKRWVILLKSLNEEQLNRCFQHPAWGTVNLKWAMGAYAWHGKHHVAHITELRKRMGWGA